MPHSSDTLTLTRHWRVGVPPGIDLVAGDNDITTEANDVIISTESGLTLTTEGQELPWVPSLARLKRKLRLEDEDTEDNEYILTLRDAAAAMLIKETGQDFSPQDYIGEAEYEGCEYRLIRIDRSNVQSVASVTEVDRDDAETILPNTEYAIRYKNRLPFLDGKFNENRDKASVKVAYKRGFFAESRETALLIQAVMDTVHTLYNYPGRLVDATLRRSPAFMSILNLLRDRRSTVKWTS